MRSRRILAWFVLTAVSAVLLLSLAPSQRPSPQAAPQSSAEGAARAPVAPRLAALPVREPFAPQHGELFGQASWTQPQAAASAGRRAAPSRHSMPAMPYRVAGQVIGESGMRVVLAKADRVYEVREGDTLEDGYRVESIKPDAVTLLYLPLARREQLLVSGPALRVDAAQASAPADAVLSRRADARLP
jgi:hypothetical protein